MSGEDGKMEVVDRDSSLGAAYAFVLCKGNWRSWAEGAGKLTIAVKFVAV
jgi:hypothetical protein